MKKALGRTIHFSSPYFDKNILVETFRQSCTRFAFSRGFQEQIASNHPQT